MNNKVKFCIAIIVVIVMIVICVNILKKKNNTNEVNSNVVENKSSQTEIKDEQLETKDFSNSVYESNTDAGTTNKKQEAINLVKAQWGADDTVTFTCDSITSDGIYIIAVTSKERAVVLNYFRVNLATKTVTVDY